ncbi:MAG: cyanophycinase [Cyanobacteria bacterium P01_D01_bin.123]
MSVRPSPRTANALPTDLDLAPTTREPDRISTQADLIAVGGAEDKEDRKHVLRHFYTCAGGPEAHIVVIPAASGIPDILSELYHKVFTSLGAPSDRISTLDIRNPIEARNPAAAELIQSCSAIYFTGGDQERLADVLGGTNLMELIHRRWQQGAVVIGGTSAGASALGHRMISRGYSGETPTPSLVSVKAGLGIFPHAIIDQHFHNRNRLARLLTAVAYHPDCLGIGIDEDTAAVIRHDNTLEVIGSGTVTLVDGQASTTNVTDIPSDRPYTLHDTKVHFLVAGSRFALSTRQPIATT